MSRFLSNHEVEVEVTKACHQKAFPVTIHFYLDSPISTPQPLGCGILFAFENNHFVITASHLFEGNDFKALRIMIDGTIYELNGMWKFTKPVNDEYLENIDLAVLRLDNRSELLSRLQQDRRFLKLEDLRFTQSQKVGLLPAHQAVLDGYYIIGYPASRTKYVEESNLYESTYFGIYCTLHKKNLERLEGIFGNHHLFFDYRKSGKNQKHKNKVTLPSYQGLSGTGVWRIDHFTNDGEYNIKLAGIFLQISQKETVMVGLRIDLIIQHLRTQFDLPKLPKINLRRSKRD